MTNATVQGGGGGNKSHDLAGSKHNADTITNLNLKLTDGTILSTKEGELNAFPAKSPVVDGDIIVIEDSAATYAKKKSLLSVLKTYVLNGFSLAHSSTTGQTTDDHHPQNGVYRTCKAVVTGCNAGTVCYISGDSSGTPEISLANGTVVGTTKGMLVMPLANITNGGTGTCAIQGEVTITAVAGTVYYLGYTNGTFTSTLSTTTGQFVRIIGYGFSTTVLYFNPGSTYIEVA